MLRLLFDVNFIYDILIFVGIILLFIFAFKYPQAKIYIFSFLLILFVGVTCYCGIQLNYYVQAQGGVFGYLSSLGQNNTLTIEDEKYSLNNIVLTNELNTTFSATIQGEPVVLEEQNYMVFVNNAPCSNVETTHDIDKTYINAQYSYVFMDENNSPKCTDTLNLNFSFFKNSSVVKVSTDGGQTAVNYWNNYFHNNDFIISFKADSKTNDDLVVDGNETAQYYSIKYYIDSSLYAERLYKANSTVTLIPCPESDRYTVNGWRNSAYHIYSESFEITSDMKLYLDYTNNFDESNYTYFDVDLNNLPDGYSKHLFYDGDVSAGLPSEILCCRYNRVTGKIEIVSKGYDKYKKLKYSVVIAEGDKGMTNLSLEQVCSYLSGVHKGYSFTHHFDDRDDIWYGEYHFYSSDMGKSVITPYVLKVNSSYEEGELPFLDLTDDTILKDGLYVVDEKDYPEIQEHIKSYFEKNPSYKDLFGL